MRNLMPDEFISCVVNNRGGAVAPLGKTGRCDVCRRKVSRDKPVAVWLELSKIVCTDCTALYLKDLSLLNYVEKTETKKIGAEVTVLDLMQGSDLGRLVMIAHSDTHMLQENYGSTHSNLFCRMSCRRSGRSSLKRPWPG